MRLLYGGGLFGLGHGNYRLIGTSKAVQMEAWYAFTSIEADGAVNLAFRV